MTNKPPLTFNILSELADLACTREQQIFLAVTNDWAPYYNFLHLLADYMRPRLIVELGVLHGMGTAHLAAGSPTSTVIGMDISFVGLDPQFSWPNVLFVEGDPLHMIWKFPIDVGFGICFIDSEHTYGVTMPQYRKFRQYMLPGGVILLDDIHLCEEMERVWADIAEPKMELPNLHDSGFGAVLIGE